ncbi:MAG: polysaccharide deacetylase family protein, partial [bacterium]|nr:polysaccharide deacetylase family protein [bacterium]
MEKSRKHLLTVAVEDYFHSAALNPLIPSHHWKRFESRVPDNTRRALDMLERHGARATFFVLGWIAEQMPEVVREIVDRGHEVASKGYLHEPLQQMTRREFRDDLLRARDVLERATGRAIVGHRVAQGSIGLDDLWALDTMAANGFVY